MTHREILASALGVVGLCALMLAIGPAATSSVPPTLSHTETATRAAPLNCAERQEADFDHGPGVDHVSGAAGPGGPLAHTPPATPQLSQHQLREFLTPRGLALPASAPFFDANLLVDQEWGNRDASAELPRRGVTVVEAHRQDGSVGARVTLTHDAGSGRWLPLSLTICEDLVSG